MYSLTESFRPFTESSSKWLCFTESVQKQIEVSYERFIYYASSKPKLGWRENKSYDNRDVKTNWKQSILEGRGGTHQMILERKSEAVVWLLPRKGAEPKMVPFIFAQTRWLLCLLPQASSARWFVNFNIQLCIAMGYRLCTRLPTVNILQTNKDWCRKQIMLYNFKMKT